MIQLPADFQDFLRLLNSNDVEYLLIGGYAVGYYGFPRATGDIDFWVAISPNNAEKMVLVLKEFGFDVPELSKEKFLKEDQVFRLGTPPFRIEVLTTISGVSFQECFSRKIQVSIDGILVKMISLPDLKQNKQVADRDQDRRDLKNLP